MILLQNERVGCEHCIRGHRAADCVHLGKQLISIKGRGRPAAKDESIRLRIEPDPVVTSTTYELIETKNGRGKSDTRKLCHHLDPNTPVSLFKVKLGKGFKIIGPATDFKYENTLKLHSNQHLNLITAEEQERLAKLKKPSDKSSSKKTNKSMTGLPITLSASSNTLAGKTVPNQEGRVSVSSDSTGLFSRFSSVSTEGSSADLSRSVLKDKSDPSYGLTQAIIEYNNSIGMYDSDDGDDNGDIGDGNIAHTGPQFDHTQYQHFLSSYGNVGNFFTPTQEPHRRPNGQTTASDFSLQLGAQPANFHLDIQQHLDPTSDEYFGRFPTTNHHFVHPGNPVNSFDDANRSNSNVAPISNSSSLVDIQSTLEEDQNVVVLNSEDFMEIFTAFDGMPDIDTTDYGVTGSSSGQYILESNSDKVFSGSVGGSSPTQSHTVTHAHSQAHTQEHSANSANSTEALKLSFLSCNDQS